jgi:hypothetical protein
MAQVHFGRKLVHRSFSTWASCAQAHRRRALLSTAVTLWQSASKEAEVRVTNADKLWRKHGLRRGLSTWRSWHRDVRQARAVATNRRLLLLRRCFGLWQRWHARAAAVSVLGKATRKRYEFIARRFREFLHIRVKGVSAYARLNLFKSSAKSAWHRLPASLHVHSFPSLKKSI